MKRFNQITYLFATILFGVGISLGGVRQAAAQEAGYPTAEIALLAALGDYVTVTGETQEWTLGEVTVLDNQGYSIAKSADHANNEQGFVLLLARQQEDGLWLNAAPKVMGTGAYNEWLENTSDDLIDQFSKSFYYLYSEEEQTTPNFYRAVPLHRLPWPIREQAILTQKDGSYHSNQLDFVVRNTNDIYASKPGVVIFVKEVSDTGGCEMALWPWANMVVVQHSASEYSWYVHLKQYSVPVVVGDLIGYGTKIGEQGNTGFACGSTGIHLHYMTSSAIPASWPNPAVPNYAPWPPAGTITRLDFVEISYAALSVGQYYESANAPGAGVCSSAPTQANLYDSTYCTNTILSQNQAGLANLSQLGIGTRLESIEIPAGWSAALYETENELGPKICLSQSDSTLWNNLYSTGQVAANHVPWLRVYQSAGCPYPFEQGIALYSGANFGGAPVWGMVGERSSNGPAHTAGSIYLPGGYSVQIFDQDNNSGNSVCLTESALDLSAVPGWPGGPIQSLTLTQEDICEGPPQAVPTPILVAPVNNGSTYQEMPKLCWRVGRTSSDLRFNVEIWNAAGFTESSSWDNQTCWYPTELIGQSGEFSWQVQAKNGLGELGELSAIYNFSLIPDITGPSVAFQDLQDGSQVSWPRTNIYVTAADSETRVARVHFLAWYDNGSGTGFDWHYVGMDEDGSDGWVQTWNSAESATDDPSLWVYAEDLAGNFSSAFVSGLTIVNTSPTTEEGYEGRETGGESGAVPTPIVEQPETGEQIEIPPVEEGNAEPETQAPEEQITVTQPKPGAPVLISPLRETTYYLSNSIELCWQAGPVSGTPAFRVAVSGTSEQVSPWIGDSCWRLEGLTIGSYTWQVRVRSEDGVRGDWSESGSFQLLEDTTAPKISFSQSIPAEITTNTLDIYVSAADEHSGINKVQTLAWYGGQWHMLSEQSAAPGGSYEYSWDLSNVSPQMVEIWVYALDNAGNASFVRAENLRVVNTTSEQTYQRKALPDVARNLSGE